MAGDEQPFERLHMDNDYEGGEWIGGEFFYKSKKQKRQQTKEDQLYGVFAGDSEDEEEGGKKKRGGGGGRGKGADYTKPVAFISTGETVQPSKAEEKAGPPTRPGAGVGSGIGFDVAQAGLGSHGGLGFAPAGLGVGAMGASGGAGLGSKGGLGAAQAGSVSAGGGESMEQAEEEKEVLPTAFGQRIMKAAEERRRKAEAESKAKLRQNQAKSGKTVGDVGKFEAHTKGIGAKLLAKMGYVQGQGLGKNKQGIAKPIEAQLRPKGMGMGFGDYNESKGAPKMPGSEAAKLEEGPKEKEAPKREQGMWKKRHASERVKREYKTASEVLEASEVEGSAKAHQQPILDMRGPQARLVTNMEALEMKEHEEDGDAVPMPELQHNLRLVVDLAEAEIARVDGKLRQEKDTAVILGREQTRQELELDEVDQDLDCISSILGEVETAAKLAATPSVSLDALHSIYKRLKRAYPEQYVIYNLPALAVAQVQPHLRAKLAGLKPLQQPALGLEHLRGWRALLEGNQVKDAVFADAAAEDDPYCRLLAEIVMPQLRTAVTNEWQPRDPEPLLRWLEAWDAVLPAPTRDYILLHLVMPALQRAVDSWEPRQETIAIHTWLHPWLAWLGTQLRPLYQPIRFKLSKALEEWHPSDSSALTLLRPWHRVLDDMEWETMMNRSIVPKLAFALDSLIINPAAQDMSPFNWFTAWADIMPLKLSAQLLEKGFFPKFLQVLDHWLATSHNYDEITRWYLGWKAATPEALADHERVRRGMNSALDLMNRRMAGDTTPFVYLPAGVPPAPAQPFAASAAPTPVYAPPSATSFGLRELLQSFAEENGITFMPKAGRMWGAHQVYSFGGVSCVIEAAAGVLRAQIGDRWTPVSMEGLLAEVRKRGGV